HNDQGDDQLQLLRSFGHSYDDYFCLGLNAKMSELHAAMGMTNLPHIQRIIASRKDIIHRYDSRLSGLISRPTFTDLEGYNQAYYPVIFRDHEQRERIFHELARHDIHARRYFAPSLDTLPYVVSDICAVSRDISDRVLCLPLFFELQFEKVDEICGVI